jgi:hypothetical protein
VVLADLVGFVGFFDLVEADNYTIFSSKGTVGFFTCVGRRSEGSVIVNSFNLVVLWWFRGICWCQEMPRR